MNTYTFTLPNGKEHTIKSKRNLTHVSAFFVEEEQDWGFAGLHSSERAARNYPKSGAGRHMFDYGKWTNHTVIEL